jgi:hypothetical protein
VRVLFRKIAQDAPLVGLVWKSREIKKLTEHLSLLREAFEQSLVECFAGENRPHNDIAVGIENQHTVLTLLPVRRSQTPAIKRQERRSPTARLQVDARTSTKAAKPASGYWRLSSTFPPTALR